MAALAEMDLDTLTPEQAAAARQALAALETLRTENETLRRPLWRTANEVADARGPVWRVRMRRSPSASAVWNI